MCYSSSDLLTTGSRSGCRIILGRLLEESMASYVAYTRFLYLLFSSNSTQCTPTPHTDLMIKTPAKIHQKNKMKQNCYWKCFPLYPITSTVRNPSHVVHEYNFLRNLQNNGVFFPLKYVHRRHNKNKAHQKPYQEHRTNRTEPLPATNHHCQRNPI